MEFTMTQRPPPSPTSVMDVNAKSLMVSFSPKAVKSKEPRRPSLAQTLSLPTRELQQQTNSSFSSAYWHVLVGMAAFFDFCATVLAPYFPEDDGMQTITTKGLFFDRHHQEYVETDDPLLHDCLQCLDAWYVSIGIVFSILWFVNAVVEAQWKLEEKVDRQRLLQDERDALTGSAWRAFYCTVAFQILVLPVGFYVALWNVLTFQWSGGNDEESEECVDDSGMRSTHSLLFACLNYAVIMTNRLVGAGIRSRRKSLSRRIAKRMAKFAVRHPRLFRRRLRVSLRTVRWIKYLLPLIGGFNKLFNNTKDLLKKYRQRLKANRASQKRKKKWQELSSIEKRMAAAVLIQKSFRGMQSRRSVRALNILEGCKKTMVAIKMQKAFRASLARARERIARQKLELERLQAQAAESRMDDAGMSDDERRRMYQLQDELRQQAKELVNKKLLLRPNTTFAVTWKFLFVLCVLYEIAMKALSHKLKHYKDEKTGEPLDLSRILEQKLVPYPITEWEECAPWLDESKPSFFQTLLRTKANSNVLERCPWYCQEPAIMVQSAYILLLRFFLSSAPLVLGTICFLDVFVTFFTGEIHSENGLLMPKPFVKRWLLPGLVLQLLVNPQMETTSKYVGKMLTSINHVGPVRAWQWTAALWYPLLKSVVRVVEIYIWLPFVKQQNQKLEERKMRQTAEQDSGTSSVLELKRN